MAFICNLLGKNQKVQNFALKVEIYAQFDGMNREMNEICPILLE